jgi:hypothetical protein
MFALLSFGLAACAGGQRQGAVARRAEPPSADHGHAGRAPAETPAPPSTPAPALEPAGAARADRVTVTFRRKPCRDGAGARHARDVDVDRDGVVDFVEVSLTGVVVCREHDFDSDGRIDLVRFLDAAGRAVREEIDLDGDGHHDQVTVFRDDQRLAVIADIDADRRGDIYRCYLDGRPVVQQLDLDHDGRIDRWEWYDASGAMFGSSPDADHDGTPDSLPRGAQTFDDCPTPTL